MKTIPEEIPNRPPEKEGLVKDLAPPAHAHADVKSTKVRNQELADAVERAPWRVATVFAFILAIVCCGALGYALFRFFNILSLPSQGTHELVFLARAGIMGVATTLATTCVMLGFATFMIGARGEFRVQGEYSKSKGIMQSGAPGLFFVLCGTVVLCVLLNNKFSFDNTTSTGTSSFDPASEKEKTLATTPRAGTTSVQSGRSIASGGGLLVAYEDIGFFSQDVSAYNAFAQLAIEGPTDDNVDFFLGNWIKPIRITCVRMSWYRSNHTIPDDSLTVESLEGDKQFDLKSGYLIVPEDGRLLNEKLSALRVSAGKGKSPDLKPLVKELIPLLQSAHVFKGAEPMDGWPVKNR